MSYCPRAWAIPCSVFPTVHGRGPSYSVCPTVHGRGPSCSVCPTVHGRGPSCSVCPTVPVVGRPCSLCPTVHGRGPYLVVYVLLSPSWAVLAVYALLCPRSWAVPCSVCPTVHGRGPYLVVHRRPTTRSIHVGLDCERQRLVVDELQVVNNLSFTCMWTSGIATSLVCQTSSKRSPGTQHNIVVSLVPSARFRSSTSSRVGKKNLGRPAACEHGMSEPMKTLPCHQVNEGSVSDST